MRPDTLCSCHCGAAQCLGKIQGAKHIPIETLGRCVSRRMPSYALLLRPLRFRYFINNHIAELKEEQWLVIANGGSPGSTRQPLAAEAKPATNGHVNGHAQTNGHA